MQNTTSPARVTVLGLGLMGTAIAANLAEHGFDVRGWNRTAGRGAGLAEQGVEVLTDAAETANGADIVLTMLTDGAATAEVIRQARPAAGTVWVQMGTVGVPATAELGELAGAQGLVLVDAPVLGTVAPARQGQLLVLASGPDELRERVQPLFDTLGKRTLWLGPAGRGSAVKLALNTWLAAVVEGIAETMALATCLDIDPATILDALDGEAVASPYALMKGRNMLAGKLDPGFPLKHAAKDIAMVVAAARERGVDLPAVEATLPAWRAAVEAGGGDADIAGAGTRYRLTP
ncbi:NAD(P)-dependent oxidoreductase [Rugosimonospora africana]|uniref:3-hydroxyisobutyrate dehydrogenase n=1 Tax=Rugosimonospora africana TaxID=556532 RepID=A0A8J3QXZ6_9ACTN|nr:NAD(P)-dependent oxidoreductase [Rugosimonospora africana]GIH18344.1 3-hydroxyisobutyrate dehydrogenase [Rugosimonospora africana]